MTAQTIPLLVVLLVICIGGYRVAQLEFSGQGDQIPFFLGRALRIPLLTSAHADGDETFRFLFGLFGVGVAQIGSGRATFASTKGSATLRGRELLQLRVSFTNGREFFVVEPALGLGPRRLRRGMVVHSSGPPLERAVAAELPDPG